MPNLITAARLRDIKTRHELWACDERTQELVATLERAVGFLRFECSKHARGFPVGTKCLCSRCGFLKEFDHD